jgi:hypothetical protein
MTGGTGDAIGDQGPLQLRPWMGTRLPALVERRESAGVGFDNVQGLS